MSMASTSPTPTEVTPEPTTTPSPRCRFGMACEKQEVAWAITELHRDHRQFDRLVSIMASYQHAFGRDDWDGFSDLLNQARRLLCLVPNAGVWWTHADGSHRGPALIVEVVSVGEELWLWIENEITTAWIPERLIESIAEQKGGS